MAAANNDTIPDTMQNTTQKHFSDVQDDSFQQFNTEFYTGPEIPNELLAKIFLYCSGGKVNVPWTGKLEKPLWTLGRVCSRWRGVVLNTPQLWSNTHIECDTEPWQNSELRTEYYTIDMIQSMAKVVLARSGQVAISVVFKSDNSSEWDFDNPPEFDFHFLVPHFGRLKHLRILCAVDDFFLLPPSSFPSLETLELMDDRPPYKSRVPPFTLQNAPKLYKVKYHFKLFPIVWLARLPLSQITILELQSCMPSGAVLHILSRFQCLLRCNLWLQHSDNGTDSSLGRTESIVFPALTHFQIYIPNNVTALECLVMPRLQCLEIISWCSNLWNPKWVEMLVHASCLRTLKITGGFPISPTNIEHCLDAAGSIIELELTPLISPATFLKICSGDLVPELSTLICAVGPVASREFDFREMVRSWELRVAPVTLNLDVTLRSL